jgi:hypothetical protein
MQYRICLLLSVSIWSFAAQAQHQPTRAPMRVTSTDTIVVSRPMAVNTPVAVSPKEIMPPERKPVPLAGHKTYYLCY